MSEVQFVDSNSGSGSNHGNTENTENKIKLTVGVFNFGKYKGQSIVDVFEKNEKYCNWFLTKVDDDSKHKRYVKGVIRELYEKQ